MDNASSAWNFDEETLRLRAEFLLLVQDLIDLVSECDGEWGNCRSVLDRVLELGVKRLRVDADGENEIDGIGSGNGNAATVVEEAEFTSLRKLILEHARVFDALCVNVHRQIRHWESEDSGEGSEELEEEDVKVLRGIQRTVQVVHLDAMRESLESGDAEGAVSHIRFLHFDYGIEEQSEYRYAPTSFPFANTCNLCGFVLCLSCLVNCPCLLSLNLICMHLLREFGLFFNEEISFPFDIITTTTWRYKVGLVVKGEGKGERSLVRIPSLTKANN